MTFSLILKKGFEEHILPIISDIVESVVMHLDIKQKYDYAAIEKILDKIHESIMSILFRVDPNTAPNSIL